MFRSQLISSLVTSISCWESGELRKCAMQLYRPGSTPSDNGSDLDSATAPNSTTLRWLASWTGP